MRKLPLFLLVLPLLNACNKEQPTPEPETPGDVIADFDWSLSTMIDGVVKFDNKCQNATSYYWDFGDGTSSTAENPIHPYTANGTYTVALTATGSYKKIALKNVLVNSVPTFGSVTFWTGNYNYGSINVYVTSVENGTISSASLGEPSCGDAECFTVDSLPAGTYHVNASSNGYPYSWSKDFTVYNGSCQKVQFQ